MYRQVLACPAFINEVIGSEFQYKVCGVQMLEE